MNAVVQYIVTGSSGRLGSALIERLGPSNCIGIDPRPGPFTNHSCEDLDRAFVGLVRGPFVVFHAGSLHKPDMATKDEKEFVRLNIVFTQRLVELALSHPGLEKFVYTSTTSVFGASFGKGCLWIDEASVPCPKNIYGRTKLSAEEVIRTEDGRFSVLRACRFFPEEDDRETRHDELDEENLKFLHLLNGRRLLLEDVVDAHLMVLKHKSIDNKPIVLNLGNAVSIARDADLSENAPDSLCRAYPFLQSLLEKKQQWRLPQSIDRVYDASYTFRALAWTPKWTPAQVAQLLLDGKSVPW